MMSVKKIQGATLVEVVLVLLVSLSIAVLVFQQYRRFQIDSNIRSVRETVDNLFLGASLYYRSNCRTTLQGATSPQSLLIATGTPSLKTMGYLTTAWPPAYFNFMDTTAGENGYQISLILQQSTHTPTGNVYNNWIPQTTPTTNIVSLPATPSLGNSNVWIIHITLKLSSTILPVSYPFYINRLGATCMQATATSPCTTGALTGSYLVWELLPSTATPREESKLKWMMPRIKAFTNLYYNDDMYKAVNPTFVNDYNCGG